MGQYYRMIILGEKPDQYEVNAAVANRFAIPAAKLSMLHEIIRLVLSPHDFSQGAKLMEHSYINNDFVNMAEYMISPEGKFYKSRLVWAGDYADAERITLQNLYHMSPEKQMHFSCSEDFDQSTYRYIVNHTKREFVDKLKCVEKYDDDYDGLIVHPLPLLVSEGNGCGSGDYSGHGEDDCGRWARDVISVECNQPGAEEGYVEFITRFEPN